MDPPALWPQTNISRGLTSKSSVSVRASDVKNLCRMDTALDCRSYKSNRDMNIRYQVLPDQKIMTSENT